MTRPLVSSAIENHIKSSEARRTRVFLLSAFNEDSITTHIRRLRAYILKKGPGADDEFMNNLAYTLNERRTVHLYRVGVLGSSATDVAEALAGAARVYKAPRRPNVGFVFTGQGAQWCGMGKGLMAAYPVFRQSIRRIDAYMARIHAPFRIAGGYATPQMSWLLPLTVFQIIRYPRGTGTCPAQSSCVQPANLFRFTDSPG